jgi:FkbM family methyltransferase
MKFVSYAQNYEDVLLWRAFHDVDKGFFIDVGANAPIGDSVTYLFYEHGWRGINIEPVAQWFEMLAEIRPDDINLNAAIADTAEFLTLYDVPDTGLATADSAMAARYRQAGREVLEHRVSAVTLDAVCSKYAPATIHFLKIDVEGAEAAVIRSLDLERFRPQIILVEATLPNSTEVQCAEWETLLTSKRYDFVYFDGLNRFYVAQEVGHLREVFSTPPNVLDDFMQYREVIHRDTIARLQQRLATEKTVSMPEQPSDTAVLERMIWSEEAQQAAGTDGLLQVNTGMRLVFQRQERVEQAIWRLVKAQEEQAARDAEQLRQQKADYQRQHLEHEQQYQQWQQQYQQLQQQSQQQYQQLQQQHGQWQQQAHEQHERLLQEKERIWQELEGVYAGTAWRMTKPLRIAADRGKPLLQKVREGGSAWVRLTPESRPRRTAHQLKGLAMRVLKKLVRKAKHLADTNPLFAHYVKKVIQRFPGVHKRMARMLLRSHHAADRQTLSPSQIGSAATALYTQLKSNT